jgi:hypothetical protein
MRRKYENSESNRRQKIKKSILSAQITSRIDQWKQAKQMQVITDDKPEEIAITTSEGDFILTPMKGKKKYKTRNIKNMYN